MSVPSVRSNSTLTPVESLDHLSDSPVSATQPNSVPPVATDPSTDPITVQSREIAAVASRDSETEPEVLSLRRLKDTPDDLRSDGAPESSKATRLQRTRALVSSALNIATKDSSGQDHPSTKKFMPATHTADIMPGPDNTSTAGSYGDSNNAAKIENGGTSMYEDPELNSNENKIYDEDMKRKLISVNGYQDKMKKANPLLELSDRSRNYSENIFDSDFYDEKRGNIRNEFPAVNNFMGSGTISQHVKRESITSESMKVLKAEPAKSRRPSVHHQIMTPPDPDLQDTSRQILDGDSKEGANDENYNNPEDMSAQLSLDTKENDETIAAYSGNKLATSKSNIVEDCDSNNNTDNDFVDGLSHLDMHRDVEEIDKVTDDVSQQRKTDSKKGDLDLNVYSNDTTNSKDNITGNKENINANTESAQKFIQEHETRNIKETNLPEKQTSTFNNFTKNYTTDRRSPDMQVNTSGENMQGQRDMAIKHQIAWASVDLSDPSQNYSTKFTEQKSSSEVTISADDSGKHSRTPKAWEKINTNDDDNERDNNRSSLHSNEYSEKRLQMDVAQNMNSHTELNDGKKHNITKEKNIEHHPSNKNVKEKQGNNFSSSKSQLIDQIVHRSKSASSSLPTQALSNRQSNYKSIVEMKALDRLLSGPYSGNISHKSQSSRKDIHTKAPKSSAKLLHQQNRYIKPTTEETTSTKPTTAEKSNSASPSRKFETNDKHSTSAKSSQSHKFFAEESNTAKPATSANRNSVISSQKHETNRKETNTAKSIQANRFVYTEKTARLPQAENTQNDGSSRKQETMNKQPSSAKSNTPNTATGEDSTVTEPAKAENKNNVSSLTKENKIIKYTKLPKARTVATSADEDKKITEPTTSDNKHSINSVSTPETINKYIKSPKAITPDTSLGLDNKTMESTKADSKNIVNSVRKLDTKNNQTSLAKTIHTNTNSSKPALATPQIETKPEPAKPDFNLAVDNKTVAGNNKTSPVNRHAPKPRQAENAGKNNTKLPSLHTDKRIHADIIVSSIVEKELDMEAGVKSHSSMEKTTDSTENDRLDSLDKVSMPFSENPLEKTMTVAIRDEKIEAQDSVSALLDNGGELQLPDKPNVVTEVGISHEPDNQVKTTKRHRKGSKPTNVSKWPMTRIKIKTVLPKLKKKQETTMNTQLTNTTEYPSDCRKTDIPTNQVTQEVEELAMDTTEESKDPTDPLIPLPASVVIVDETVAPQTNSNFLIDQVILQDILHKYQAKSSPDAYNTTPDVPPDDSRESPLPEHHIANGIGKLPERSASKSVSIHSLTVPGLQPNAFSGDTPLDEDAISMYSRRDSMRQSFDSGSRKSVDYRIRNTALIVQPTADEKPKSVLTNDESFIKSAIPYLPMKLAVLCLVLNIVIPGCGTVLSGLAILFCGQPRVLDKDDQILITLCANCMVGVAQLFTVTFLLVGWFWSIGWGIEMVILAVQHERDLKEERTKELQSLALTAFGSPKRPDIFGS